MGTEFATFRKRLSNFIIFQERAQGNCGSQNHDEMDYECLMHMWNYNHVGKGNDWQPCDTFTCTFSTKKYGLSSGEFENLVLFSTQSSVFISNAFCGVIIFCSV